MSSKVERRVHQHNSGYEKTTKPYRPFTLIYECAFNSREEARKHEKYMKSSSGRRMLKKIA